jgi:hypothetical protein
VFGFDQGQLEKIVKEKLQEKGINVRFIKAKSFSPHKWKTSLIIERIKKLESKE